MKCESGVCLIGNEPYICVKDLGVTYGRRAVLANVSLDTSSCSITALIGPSGCGKTSFLNCLNRLTDHYEDCKVTGAIRIGDLNVLNARTDVLYLRRRVGMIFQKPNPFPLSIWRNLALTLKQHGISDRRALAERIETALQAVGLWDEVKDRLHASALSLSGGQQQRLCIARAVALEPDVILFDEPCSALDPISSGVVEELIRGLRSRFTVVIVTHNLAQARRISDATALFWMHGGVGRLVEYGPTQRLFEAPADPITAAYLAGRHG